MHRYSTTIPQVNKVRTTLTEREMAAYGGFALIASFLEQIRFREMLQKAVPIV